MTQAEKFKRLAALGKTLSKKYDTENALVCLGDKVGHMIPSISTGLPSFDYGVLGCGGIPKGRILEVYGDNSAGKTSFTLHVIGQCQAAGGIAAFIDSEHALDATWSKTLGVDVEKLIVAQPGSGEEALDIVDQLVETQAVDLIVIDSVAALTPAAELAGEIGDAHVGQLSRMMSQAMRILTGKCARNSVTLLFTNQLRERIGQMWGNPETTPGGRALKFYSSVRLSVNRKEELKEGNTLVGHVIRIKATKCKVGIPFREASVSLFYDSGFDTVGDTIAYASTLGVFEMSGSWYSYNGERLANGLANLKVALRNNEKVMTEIRKKIAEGSTPAAKEV